MKMNSEIVKQEFDNQGGFAEVSQVQYMSLFYG
jgi:hypothetical protein